MNKFLTDCANIDFTTCDSQTHKTSRNHEDIIRTLFLKNHFVECSKAYFKVNMLLPNEFVYQPYGSQRYPDFIVGTTSIECKSARTRIMWNDGYPRTTGIYIISDTKNNNTFVVHGSNPWFIDPKLIDMLIQQKEHISRLNKEYSDEQFKLYWRGGHSQSLKQFRNLTKIEKLYLTKHTLTKLR